ncbi:helix-turn-helix domain-containing protein [Nocardiopsis sp. CC223A]|uniref:helix-turn-helix domain-containing protein n=1 Tax=Nocardiopsis sp. CC223A TaxID=3044051 RepID=UPI0035568A0A
MHPTGRSLRGLGVPAAAPRRAVWGDAPGRWGQRTGTRAAPAPHTGRTAPLRVPVPDLQGRGAATRPRIPGEAPHGAGVGRQEAVTCRPTTQTSGRALPCPRRNRPERAGRRRVARSAPYGWGLTGAGGGAGVPRFPRPAYPQEWTVDDEWLTTRQVAEMWGVTVRTVQGCLRRGHAPAVRRGDHRWWMRRQDAEEAAEKIRAARARTAPEETRSR